MTQATAIVRLIDTNDPTRFAESRFSLPVEDFILTGTSGEIEINNAAGEITLTVTTPLPYSSYNTGNGPGVFAFNVDALTQGPP